MAEKFVPLNTSLIDEGQFMEDLNSELKATQEKLALYRRQFGDKSLKAEAKITIEIKLSIVNADDGAYGVKTQIKTTMPKRPASVSFAMEHEDEDGNPALFVRKSGSDDSDPRQLKFAKRNGEMINSGVDRDSE